MKELTIYVYADWPADGPVLVGRLFSSESRGKEVFSFEFNKAWLRRPEAQYTLDPDLFFHTQRQFVPSDKPIFGVFADSCPDRWGRKLMQRREAIVAKREDRKPRRLSESDYLLGVFDETRMGAFRYSLNKGDMFLSSDRELAAPPWVALRKLEAAAYSLDSDTAAEEEKWINMLLAPGSSLGGARPKASVYGPDGDFWIAKFPSKTDEINIGAWEAVVHTLAQQCYLDVPEGKLMQLSKNGGTFLSKRFDRENGKRIHFASAMTLLGKTDGNIDASYLDIASFIRAHGATPGKDLQELWKRIVFHMCVSNTDDHLRNHGFLLRQDGWHLSPAYDINPTNYGEHLHLCVTEYDSAIDLDLALETAGFYDVSLTFAREYIESTKVTIDKNWRRLAIENGIGRAEIERMAPAFLAAKPTPSLDAQIHKAKETGTEACRFTSRKNLQKTDDGYEK